MKILTIFADMIRPNRLSTFNDRLKEDTPIDTKLRMLGGTVYTNCFTPGPDTPRSTATFLTGVDPYLNGCNTRLKWPKKFLKNDIKTIFDLFLEKDFSINSFSSIKERDTGLFPQRINNLNIHNIDHNLDKYLSQIQLQNDHFVYISTPDFHWALDDLGYNSYGEKKAYLIIDSVLDIIFHNLNKDDFDHIFIYSDHGFKFEYESKLEDKRLLLNDDRTNVLLFHRSKFDDALKKDTRLCSLADMMSTFKQILNEDTESEYSIFNNNIRDHVVIEDHLNFSPSINQNIELWAVVRSEATYIRTVDDAITLDRSGNIISSTKDAQNDQILFENSTFRTYLTEYENIFLYRNNILTKNNYMNGIERVAKSTVHKKIITLFDVIKSKYYQ